ncbi:CDP-glycerol glycerophosphotransferase family protein [Faecalibacillus intestinalis]|uniref:CDP-glycerol glycerophosphotransferase family protein n=1 Tax=Faecalibacillus intestinalis TaxID=1982626 RepID=UPI003AB51FA9
MIQDKYLYKIIDTYKRIKREIYWKVFEKPIASILYYLPMKKDRIIFDNFGGKGFGGNPKFIAEALHEKCNKIEIIWLEDNLEKFLFPEYIKPVKIDSILALYMRSTACIWVDNIRHRHPMKKKKTQVYLQTWHGSMGAKRVEKDAESLLTEKYTKEARYDGKITNAIIADNHLQEQIYLRAFWLNKDAEILRFGFPQNDEIEQDKDNIIKKTNLRKDLKLNESYYYVLYAPTFRDDFSTKGYEIDYEKIIQAFESRMNKKTKIIVRLHPNVAFQKESIRFDDNILDGTDYPNIQDIALVSDAVISDYSSSLFDFAVLGKPAFVCALDYDEYKEKRGFIPEFYEFPFPFAKSNEELIGEIENFDKEKYDKLLGDFYKKYPTYSDGHASEKVADWVLGHMNL